MHVIAFRASEVIHFGPLEGRLSIELEAIFEYSFVQIRAANFDMPEIG